MRRARLSTNSPGLAADREILDLVGMVHPGRGPDQIAIEAQQTLTMRAVHAL